jgi:RNA polymerase sigma-70 factor, ECF subfamily
VLSPNDTPALSDEALMERVQRADLEAFEVLFDRHWATALRVAASVCRDRGRAEDAVQEAFLELWRDRSSYRPEAGSFRSWALALVRYRAIDAVRREGTRPPLATWQETEANENANARSPEPPSRMIDHEESASLRASIARLPDEQAEVIVLAFFGELSHREIAERLSLPPGTVKGRMRLGLDKLRAQLERSTTSGGPGGGPPP